MATPHALLELLYEAMEEECGLAVETNKPDLLRQKLYAALRTEQLPLRLTIAKDELWIIKKEVYDENRTAQENAESQKGRLGVSRRTLLE